MPVSVRRCSVTVIGPDLRRLLEFGVAVRASFSADVVHTTRPMPVAKRSARNSACTLLPIRREDSIVELCELLAVARPSTLLFLAQELPLKPSIARLIRRAGHAVLAANEPVVTIEATVIALLAHAAVAR